LRMPGAVVRKAAIRCLLKASGSRIPANLREIRELDRCGTRALSARNEESLSDILDYAFTHVPYYRELLGDCSVCDGETVRLENFARIPPLTKEILRTRFEDLKSDETERRKGYLNTSGGSTGEPVRFIQDPEYRDWNIANKLYYKLAGGQDIGDPELRLWGSDRDLLVGRENFRVRLKNRLYNRKEMNSFRMTPETMRRYVAQWKAFRPRWVEAYVQAIYEFAAYLERNRLDVPAPNGIVTTAGALYPEMREKIESTFGCTVYNRYGSREVGDMACSCRERKGLHLSPWNHYLEILDDSLAPVRSGEAGKIHVTTLRNRSMPLIRYDIGDLAVPAKNPECPCGRGSPLIRKVEGREMCVFRTRDGRIVPGEFFIHFIGVVFNRGYVSRFQVIQESYDLLRIKIILRDETSFRSEVPKIEKSIRKVMGQDCEIRWEPVETIPAGASGKYMYTISRVSPGR